MPSTTQSTQFDTLTPIQIQVLQSLVEGLSVTAAAKEASIHRTPSNSNPGPPLEPHSPRLRPCLSHPPPESRRPARRRTRRPRRHRHQHFSTHFERRISLGLRSLEGRHGDRKTCRSPTPQDTFHRPRRPNFEKLAAPFGDLINPPKTAPAPKSTPVGRNAPCPCGSPLKYKRCCGNPIREARAA